MRVLTGIDLRTNHRATAIDPDAKLVTAATDNGPVDLSYDRLVIGTGAEPLRPPIAGLDSLGTDDGVHLLHTIDDARRLDADLVRRNARQVIIIGAGYIGIEMAEALVNRGLNVTVLERLDTVLPRTLDRELADEITTELVGHGVEVSCGTTVAEIQRDGDHLVVTADDGTRRGDAVLVVSGVTPDSALAASAGVATDSRGTIIVDRRMRTNLPDVWAAGDCAHTHHVLLPEPTYVPLGTTAHKQGRVAGENAAGGDREFAGIAADTQLDVSGEAVEEKVFDLMARQAPVANELRMLIAALRMVADLERMGDLAAHISKIARMRYPAHAIPAELQGVIADMGRVAERMVNQAGDVIQTRDVEAAYRLESTDDEMDKLRSQFRLMMDDSWPHGVEVAVDIALLGRYYERIADHAVSMARRVVFLVTGELPAPQ